MYRGVIQDGPYWTDYLRDYIKANKLELPVNLGRIWRVVHETTKRDREAVPVEGDAGRAGEAVLASERLVSRHRAAAARRAAGEVGCAGAEAAGARRARTIARGCTRSGRSTASTRSTRSRSRRRSPTSRQTCARRRFGLSERWLGEASHPLHAAVVKLTDDPNWTVRRQVAASLGALPQGVRAAPVAAVLQEVPEAIRSPSTPRSAELAGLEAEMLEQLLQGTRTDCRDRNLIDTSDQS